MAMSAAGLCPSPQWLPNTSMFSRCGPSSSTHDCHVANDTIFGPHATLGGHVAVEDFANISAGSAVHQFCRVGQHGFIGGYSVITKDALPFAKTVGNRARIYGINTIGLIRRGFSQETIAKLRRASRDVRRRRAHLDR